jgi:MFS family permease
VGFLVTFAMFAQFFFVTLYMQNVLHYSPLQTGVRFLPSTLVIIVMGPLAGRLTDRVGPRPLMTLGLVIVSTAILIQSRLTVHGGYGLLLPGFVLMGLGMGLVMSPMSTAAMNAVDRTKAGAASGVLSMSRMVGSTFGVAIMGALVATIGRDQINHSLPHLPSATRAAIGQLARQRRHDRRSPRDAAADRRHPASVRVCAQHRPRDRRRCHPRRRRTRLDADPAASRRPRGRGRAGHPARATAPE